MLHGNRFFVSDIKKLDKAIDTFSTIGYNNYRLIDRSDEYGVGYLIEIEPVKL
jgi:hypothetical protein